MQRISTDLRSSLYNVDCITPTDASALRLAFGFGVNTELKHSSLKAPKLMRKFVLFSKSVLQNIL